MSDFAQLKQRRKEKGPKSYTFNSPDNARKEGQTGLAILGDDSAIVDNADPPPTVPPLGGLILHHHEGLYSQMPQTLDIRLDRAEGGSGRGVYSRFHRMPGDILLSIKPHVASLSNEHLDEYCSNCFAAGSALRRCVGCKTMYYCDAACQNADWTLHKQECASIQRWSSSDSGMTIPGDAIRCLGRILRRKKKLGRSSVWAKEMDALQSHRTSISKDPNSRDSQVYTQLAHAIVHFLGLNSPQEMAEYGIDNASDLVDLVSRFTTNTFTISTPALAPLGACVSPLVALINHSCDPNAVVVFPRSASKDHEPLMQVIALKNIAPDEEILTAYIDTTLPHDIRQQQLRETYHFVCRCSLCAPSTNGPVDFREAILCRKKCGGMCPLPTEENSLTRCAKCKAPVKDTDAVLDAVRIGQEALDKAEALQFSNPQKSIQLTTNLIPILTSAGLVPSAHPLLALSRLNASLLIAHLPSMDPNIEEIRSPEVQSSSGMPTQLTPKETQEALDDTIRAATRSCTGLSHLLTEGHPVRGVALAELGKLLAVDEPYPADIEKGKLGSESASSSLPPNLHMPMMKVAPVYPPSGSQRLKLAYETLVRARNELLVGFGGKNEGGEVGKGVRKLAVDLEKELMVWKDGVRNALTDARLSSGAAKR